MEAVVEEIVQLLANLYPRGIPPEVYEDVAHVSVARVRAEMYRKKRLVPGQGWVDVDGVIEPFKPRAQVEAPHLNIPPDRPHRRYDLPSDSDIKALEREDASKYPSIKSIAERVQRELASGRLQVHDDALRVGNADLMRVAGPDGSERIVPRYLVSEVEQRRIDAADAARIAEKYAYRETPPPQNNEPVTVAVGAPRAVQHAAPGERILSFNDVLYGPSMPKPVQD